MKDDYGYKICLRGLPWDIWFRCPGVHMGFLFNPVFRFFFRCCDTGHRIGINIRTIIIDGKEMSVWEKELFSVDDGVLRTLDGKRCVH